MHTSPSIALPLSETKTRKWGLALLSALGAGATAIFCGLITNAIDPNPFSGPFKAVREWFGGKPAPSVVPTAAPPVEKVEFSRAPETPHSSSESPSSLESSSVNVQHPAQIRIKLFQFPEFTDSKWIAAKCDVRVEEVGKVRSVAFKAVRYELLAQDGSRIACHQALLPQEIHVRPGSFEKRSFDVSPELIEQFNAYHHSTHDREKQIASMTLRFLGADDLGHPIEIAID